MTDDDSSWDPHLLLRDHLTPDQVKWRNRPRPAPDGIWTAVAWVLLIEAIGASVIILAMEWI